MIRVCYQNFPISESFQLQKHEGIKVCCPCNNYASVVATEFVVAVTTSHGFCCHELRQTSKLKRSKIDTFARKLRQLKPSLKAKTWRKSAVDPPRHLQTSSGVLH